MLAALRRAPARNRFAPALVVTTVSPSTIRARCIRSGAAMPETGRYLWGGLKAERRSRPARGMPDGHGISGPDERLSALSYEMHMNRGEKETESNGAQC